MGAIPWDGTPGRSGLPSRRTTGSNSGAPYFSYNCLSGSWSKLGGDYIHAQGIVHGDLHLGNILLKVPPNFDQLPLKQLYEKYGAPELEHNPQQERVVQPMTGLRQAGISGSMSHLSPRRG
jgi:serine/threonine protein kinase